MLYSERYDSFKLIPRYVIDFVTANIEINTQKVSKLLLLLSFL